MKRLLILFVVAATMAAFGQGKVILANDSLHLVYLTPDTTLLKPADVGLAGKGPSTGVMPSGAFLVADLYAGPSSATLTLAGTTSLSPTAGRITTSNATLPGGMPGGSPLYFQVQVRDLSYASAAASLAGGSYGGSSVIFTTVPGTSLFNSIVDPTFSTWPPGDFDMSAQTGIPGAKGAIRVSLIPEPGVLVLAGLGVCAWGARKWKGNVVCDRNQ